MSERAHTAYLRDEEATNNVDSRDTHSSGSQHLGHSLGDQIATHQGHTSSGSDARNSVGHRHQRRVQSRGDLPHDRMHNRAKKLVS